MRGEKKPPGLPAVFREFLVVFFRTVQNSRPPAALENQKWLKKERAICMGLM
jgi:hypothetical protein